MRDDQDELPSAPASRLIAGGSPTIGTPTTLERPAPRTAWEPSLVEARLVEAFGVLNQQPSSIGPRGYTNSMPRHLYDADDLRAQREFFDLKQYQRVAAIENASRARNRVRIMPSPAEIRRSEEALAWPMAHLRGKPEIARAVCLAALWTLRGIDVGRACKRVGIARRTFYRRKEHGLTLIAIALTQAKVPPA